MFDDFAPSKLHQAFEEYGSLVSREDLTRRCRTKVTAWKWARGEMWRPEPFPGKWKLQHARWLKSWEPRRWDDLRHGIDDGGQVHVAEEWCFNGKRTNTCHAETYIVRAADSMNTVRYRYRDRGDVELLHRFEFEEGRLRRSFALGEMFCSESHFKWENGRLTNVLTVGWDHLYVSSSRSWEKLRVSARSVASFAYDDQGELKSIVEQSVNQDGTACEGLPTRTVYTQSVRERWFRWGRAK
jgi:hypothetical protein